MTELGDCIFGYLASKSSEALSVAEIFTHITGDTGHRCDQLSKNKDKDDYKRKFFEVCDNLDSNFKNIHKYYNDGLLYLMFCEDSDPKFYNLKSTNMDTYTFDQNIILDYFLKNINNINPNNKYTEFVKNYLSKCTVDDAKRIFEQYNFNSDEEIFGTNFMKIAIQNNNVELVQYLVKQRYSGKITKLKASNLVLKKNNTMLLLKNNTLDNQNKKLLKELKLTNSYSYINKPMAILVTIIVLLVAYIFH